MRCYFFVGLARAKVAVDFDCQGNYVDAVLFYDKTIRILQGAMLVEPPETRAVSERKLVRYVERREELALYLIQSGVFVPPPPPPPTATPMPPPPPSARSTFENLPLPPTNLPPPPPPVVNNNNNNGNAGISSGNGADNAGAGAPIINLPPPPLDAAVRFWRSSAVFPRRDAKLEIVRTLSTSNHQQRP
jgi:hypothetical protein